MDEKLLKLKNITALHKLVIMVIMEEIQYSFGCRLTSNEFAKKLGVSRKQILDILTELEEMDYIMCKITAPIRCTYITKRLKTKLYE